MIPAASIKTVIGPAHSIKNSGILLLSFLEDSDEDSVDIDIKNEVIEDTSNAKDPLYDCPHCGQVFSNFAEVEGHIITEHKDITRQIVKCSECKKVLPNDQKAIKHHMITEHITPKQKPVVTPKKIMGVFMPKPRSVIIDVATKTITEIMQSNPR